MALLQGPVIFIDDEVADSTKPAYALAQQIRRSGRPLAEYDGLPPEDHEKHWRSIAFLVLDWDLVPGSPGAVGGSTLSQFARESLFEWLEGFIDRVFCPIFIISAEDVEDIQSQLAENANLQRVVDSGRMTVFPKKSLMESFVQYLEDWVSGNPALTALNIWANECESASDRLFHDMEKLAPDWPVYVWNSASRDKIDPSFELASVLTANLLHRMDVLEFDVPAIRDFQGQPTSSAMRRVTQGRTALPKDRLYTETILPGDMFSDGDGAVWINVTPSCHTVLKRTAGADGDPDPTRLFLDVIRGERLERPPTSKAFNRLNHDHDGVNGMLVHFLLGETPYAFNFRSRKVMPWSEISESRIGRLLPPYITRLQQRYAAFLLTEGLPRVDWDLYNDES